MNAPLIAAAVLVAGVVPCGIVVLREPEEDALAGLQLASTLVVLALLLVAEGAHRSSYFVLPLLLAPMALLGTVLFARYLRSER